MKSSHPAADNIIGTRLKLEMKKRGVTSTELARRADVLTSFLYDIISGKSTNPSTVKLARVAEALGISLSTLIHDESDANTSSNKDYVTIPRISVNAPAAGGGIITFSLEDEAYSFRKIWIEKHLRASVDDLRMLSINGDSMEPTLHDKDMVLIDTSKQSPTPPGVFVLFDGLGLVAKRIEYVSHPQIPRIRIISDNPHYSTYERSAGEISIIGRVVWFAREI